MSSRDEFSRKYRARSRSKEGQVKNRSEERQRRSRSRGNGRRSPDSRYYSQRPRNDVDDRRRGRSRSRDRRNNSNKEESASHNRDRKKESTDVKVKEEKDKIQQRNSNVRLKEPQWGRAEEYEEEKTTNTDDTEKPKFKPDFGLSGALAKDERTGNMVNGVVLKFTEPFEAAVPDKNWRLYVYKGEELVETLHIHRRSCFLIGRDDRVVDIPTIHPSCSLQHAVIQFRSIEKKELHEDEQVTIAYIKPYIMDLQSTHGTFLNGSRIEDSRYYELLEGDLLKFGGSSRDYVLLHSHSSAKDL